MNNILNVLLVVGVLVVVVLVVSAGAALGVAAIGLLLHRWFDLTQWQGSLVALAIAVFLGYSLVRLSAAPSLPTVFGSDYDDWDELTEDDEVDDIAAETPKVVPWRTKRPTPGDLPADSKQPPERGKRR